MTTTRTDDETLIGVTTRRIWFREIGRDDRTDYCGTFEAGTTVHVTGLDDGWVSVRIPGTLLEQRVTLSSVEPA